MDEGIRLRDMGRSVLHEMSSPVTDAMEQPHEMTGKEESMSMDMAFDQSPIANWSPGGNSGAVISPAPELGLSSYQSPKALGDGK